jgi:MoxR-like ATPase
MQENSVSASGKTYALDQPFFVLATQNPIEMEGTYPLPEAQLDRFFFKLKMDFPGLEDLHDIVERTTQQGVASVDRILDQAQIIAMRDTVRSVPVARPVQEYAIRITLATHPESSHAHPLTKRYVRFGSSPRGTQALILGAKVHALMNQRVYVSSADIKAVVKPALRHRILLNFEAEAERVDTDAILDQILNSTATPAE